MGLSNDDYKQKWGDHYTRSLLSAHRLQQCHNYKVWFRRRRVFHILMLCLGPLRAALRWPPVQVHPLPLSNLSAPLLLMPLPQIHRRRRRRRLLHNAPPPGPCGSCARSTGACCARGVVERCRCTPRRRHVCFYGPLWRLFRPAGDDCNARCDGTVVAAEVAFARNQESARYRSHRLTHHYPPPVPCQACRRFHHRHRKPTTWHAVVAWLPC